jgi:uncharacterized tellurite resistance protein B-like protein
MLNSIKTFFDQHLIPESGGNDQDAEHRLRLAVGALLLEMTRVDYEVHAEERDAVEAAVLEHFDLRADELQELLELAEAERSGSTDYFQFTSLINDVYTPEQKVGLVELLWRIAYADKSLHHYEEHLVRKIADLLHVPHRAFIAAKHKARRDG